MYSSMVFHPRDDRMRQLCGLPVHSMWISFLCFPFVFHLPFALFVLYRKCKEKCRAPTFNSLTFNPYTASVALHHRCRDIETNSKSGKISSGFVSDLEKTIKNLILIALFNADAKILDRHGHFPRGPGTGDDNFT